MEGEEMLVGIFGGAKKGLPFLHGVPECGGLSKKKGEGKGLPIRLVRGEDLPEAAVGKDHPSLKVCQDDHFLRVFGGKIEENLMCVAAGGREKEDGPGIEEDQENLEKNEPGTGTVKSGLGEGSIPEALVEAIGQGCDTKGKVTIIPDFSF
jgi:hypothetical protein